MKEFFRPLLYGIVAAAGAFGAIAAALWGPAGLALTSSAYIWLAVGSLLPGAVAFLLEYRAGKDRLENKAALENLEKKNDEALGRWKEQITDANVDRGNTARLLSILGGAIMRIIYTSDPEERSQYVGIFEQRLVELLRLALERRENSSGGIRVIFLSKGRPSNQPADEKLTPIIFYAQSVAGSNVNRTCLIRQSTRDETSAEEVLAQRGRYEYGLLVEAVNLKSADENPLLIADDGVMSYCRVAVRDPLVEHGILCVDSWVPNALGAEDREVIGAFAEGIWSVLKGGVLANLAVASFAHLVQVIRHGLKKIQYQPGLIEGCLAGTGLTLDQATTKGHQELKTFNSRRPSARLG